MTNIHIDFHTDIKTRAWVNKFDLCITLCIGDDFQCATFYMPIEMLDAANKMAKAFNARAVNGPDPDKFILGSTINLDDEAMQAIERRDLP